VKLHIAKQQQTEVKQNPRTNSNLIIRNNFTSSHSPNPMN